MGFEKVVLEKVQKAAPDAVPYFCNGTLFVIGTPREAAKIETILNKNRWSVIVTPQPANEFSFDFV